MGINFNIFVIDRNNFELLVKKGKVAEPGVTSNRLLSYMESEDSVSKLLFHDRSYWMEILYNTTCKKRIFNEYSTPIKKLLGLKSSTDLVFNFQEGNPKNQFLEDCYGGHTCILNAENSMKFIEYLKVLVSKDFVYIEDQGGEGDFLNNRPFYNEYDKNQEGKKIITEVTHNESARSYLDDIIKGFEKFPSSEKCLIGFYS